MKNIICSGFSESEVLSWLDGMTAQIRTEERIRCLRASPAVWHVRITEKETQVSPLIPLGQADLIISREPWDALRVLGYLKKDGAVQSGDSGRTDREAGCDRNMCLSFLRRRVQKLEIQT